jgi:PilZ domain
MVKVLGDSFKRLFTKNNEGTSRLAEAGLATRKEQRLYVALPIVVVVDSENGRKSYHSCTYELSRTGARISKVEEIVAVGQALWVERQGRRAPYQVTWIGEPGAGNQSQVGLQLLDLEKTIWDDEIYNQLL